MDWPSRKIAATSAASPKASMQAASKESTCCAATPKPPRLSQMSMSLRWVIRARSARNSGSPARPFLSRTSAFTQPTSWAPTKLARCWANSAGDGSTAPGLPMLSENHGERTTPVIRTRISGPFARAPVVGS